MLPGWGYGLLALIERSRDARVRRGQTARVGLVSLAAALASGTLLVGLAIDTFNVTGPDVGGLGLALVLWSFFLVAPVAILALSALAVAFSFLIAGERRRDWLDRTIPFFLGSALVVALPAIYGVVLAYGGDATLC